MHDGHYYSDKAPGVTVAALPAFLAAAGLLKLFNIPLDSDSGWLLSSWIACSGSVALITALGGVGVFIWLCKWVQACYAYLTTLALFLGAAPLPYSTLLMSHAFVVGLIGIALWAGVYTIRNESPGAVRFLKLRTFVAGWCCGLALASEYSAGIIVTAIMIYISIARYERLLTLTSGFALALMLIPTYHWICFGTPFTIAYHHEIVFTKMHEGFFGIRFPPNLEQALSLLISSEQGIFFWSPVLLIAFAGYIELYKISSRVFWLMCLVPIIQILAIAGYSYPSAGGLLGPRLLAPILITMALPTALGIVRFPRIGCFLATLSVMITVVATVIDIVAPYKNRLSEYYWPSLIQGTFSYNIGAALGLPAHASLIPLLLGLSFGIWLSARKLFGFTQSNRRLVES